MTITKSLYGESNGVKVHTSTLENKNGMKA